MGTADTNISENLKKPPDEGEKKKENTRKLES